MHKLFIALCLVLSSCMQNNHTADIVLLNGRIWTGENDSSFVQALAINGNYIAESGYDEEISKWITEKTKVIDLQGKLVIPGFNDSHIHLLSGSVTLSQIDLLATTSLAEMKAAISTFAAAHPEKEWLTGRGWQYGFFPGGMPDKSYLDSLVPDRPVFIRAYDGHSGLANSLALKKAGITRNTRFEGFGKMVTDANGEPTGALLEGAQSLVSKIIPPLTEQEKLDALRSGLRYASSLGITSVQNADGNVEDYSLYKKLLEKNEMPLRLNMAFSVNGRTTEDEIAAFIRIKEEEGKKERLKGQAIKFMLDGVIESHTAVMLQPYSDLPIHDKQNRPNYNIPPDTFQSLVNKLDKAGFQLFTHAIGDGAVRTVLDAYENAAKMNGKKDRRHRIEHIEQVSAADIPRFGKLGVLPSMQPIHADPGTVDVWSKAVGAERLPRSFPWRSMLDNDAVLTFGADWPACISLDPIRGIHNAVNRQTINGVPPMGWLPEQCITLPEALKAYTVTGAFASFDEANKGKLKKGFLADLVVLSQDLFQIEKKDIHQTKVVLTMMDGNIVFEKN